jgi:hypothetical protein
MAFNGSGTFVRIKNWVLNASLGINILPDLMDLDTQDIANGLSMCVTRDGQGAPAANISWSGFLINNLGTPLTGTDAANKGYVDIATADRSMGGFKLTNLATPIAGTDAANMAYVQSFAYSVAYPAQPGNAYLSLITNGATVLWGVSAAESLAILNFIGY